MIPIWDSTASLLTAPPAPLLASGCAPGNTLAAQHYNYQFYHLTKELNAVLTAAGVGQNAAIDNQLLTSFYALISVSGTAAALASSNPVLRGGEIAYETDTISYKIGDGSTAYNSLTYVYRGLPVASEPSRGTMHPHYKRILDNYDPNSTPTNYSVSLAAEVPVGCKSIYGGFILGYSPTVNREWGAINSANGQYMIKCISHTAGTANETAFGFVDLDASRNVAFLFNNADIIQIYFDMFYYVL